MIVPLPRALVALLCLLVPSLTCQEAGGEAEKPKSEKPKAEEPEKEPQERGPIVVRPKGRRSPGTAASTAIRRGLSWLARAQKPDGKFEAANRTNDIGVTGLAVLAFLGGGSTTRAGRHDEAIERAVAWLVEQQDEDGLIGTKAGRTFVYNHAIATLALIETLALSQHRKLEAPAKKALGYIMKARNPYKVWRYFPRDGDNDTSVTGWMAFALAQGRAHGLAIDKDSLRYVLAWLDQVTDPATGSVGYTRRGEGSSRDIGATASFPAAKTEALTAIGIATRVCCGESVEKQPLLLRATKRLLDKPPSREADSIDYYYWFHASHAMSRLGEPHPTVWRDVLEPILLARQEREGDDAGSWPPDGVWCSYGGRVYATAMATLSLALASPKGRVLR